MTGYTITIAVLLAGWAAFGIFGPRIRLGNKDENTATSVIYRGDPAVLVQELGEFRLSKIVSVTLGFIALALVVRFGAPIHPVFGLILPAFAAAIGERFRQLFISDSAGHGAEIIAAEKAGRMGFREEEIRRLQYERNWQKGLNFTPDTAEALIKISHRLEGTRWLAKFVHWLGKER